MEFNLDILLLGDNMEELNKKFDSIIVDVDKLISLLSKASKL